MYVEAVRRQGHALRKAEFEAYAAAWEPKVTKPVDWTALRLLSEMDEVTANSALGRGRVVEPMLDFMVRVRWMTLSAGEVDITPLGRAVLRESNTPLPASDTGSTVEVVIDPNDPFAYAQLMSKITSLDSCMVIDPYLDVDQLLTLANYNTVTRVLTGTSKLKQIAPVFAQMAEKVPHLALRSLKQNELHDRFIIPEQGSAYMLGSSLNSITKRFGVATTLEPSSSKLISKHYDTLWGKADQVPQKESEVVSRKTDQSKAEDATTSTGELSEHSELPG
jgi:hypothetical protein